MNIPLVEAILEVRWNYTNLQNQVPGMPVQDPNFTFFSGDFFNNIKDDFPKRKLIQNIPIELQLPHVVQHRYYKEENTWPLVQLGPGIFTINETTQYKWSDFSKLSNKVFSEFTNCKADNYILDQLDLIYINSFPIEHENNLFEQLKNSVNVNFILPSFNNESVKQNPSLYNSNFSFDLTDPNGIIHINFTKGQVNQKDSIILQLNIQSKGIHIREYQDDISKWLEKAHSIAESVFFSFNKEK